MSLDIPHADAPSGVELDREHHLRIEWPDGRTATFALETLRDHCPCAECRGRRETGVVLRPQHAPVHARGAELVGNWGISIEWADGHSAGIFAWGILRAWAGIDDAPEGAERTAGDPAERAEDGSGAARPAP